MCQKVLLLKFSLYIGPDFVKRILTMPALLFLSLEIATLAFVGALQSDSTSCAAWKLLLFDHLWGFRFLKWSFFLRRLRLQVLTRVGDFWFEWPKLRNRVQVIAGECLLRKTINVLYSSIFALFFRLLIHLLSKFLRRAGKWEGLWSG